MKITLHRKSTTINPTSLSYKKQDYHENLIQRKIYSHLNWKKGLDY